MKKKSFKNKIFFLFLAIVSGSFFSCSDSTPSLANCTSTVIFSYKDDSSLPDVKLSAYVETISEVRRVDFFSVENRASKIKWVVENPYIFTDLKNNWASGINLLTNEGETIPTGVYDVLYQDAQGQQVSGLLNVYYPQELYEKNFLEAESFLKDLTVKNIVFYDKNDVLVSFVAFNSSWANDDEIFSSNASDAQKYRICYSSKEGSYIVLSKYVEKSEKIIEETQTQDSEKN